MKSLELEIPEGKLVVDYLLTITLALCKESIAVGPEMDHLSEK